MSICANFLYLNSSGIRFGIKSSFDTAFTTKIHCVLLIWQLVAWINFLVDWKLRICLSNRIWTGAVTEGNSRTALPSWLCIYRPKSWARTWRNEPWCAVATHGIPPFPDHCHLEIPENVITFDKKHSTSFVRIIETFLFKSISLCITRKLDHALEKKPNLEKGAGCYNKIIEENCS